MKSLLFGLLFCFVVLAHADEDAKADNKKADEIKVFKRLIPADVLRGKWTQHPKIDRY